MREVAVFNTAEDGEFLQGMSDTVTIRARRHAGVYLRTAGSCMLRVPE